MAGNVKLLEQVYQTKTLSLKALQHPQVILRHAGYSLLPCLRTPHTNSQGEQPGPVWWSWVRAGCHRGSRGTAPWALWAGHRDNRAPQAKCSQAREVEPNWQETDSSGSAAARQGGTIYQPGQMSNSQVGCQQGSQGRGSYQMKSQERLQGSRVQ